LSAACAYHVLTTDKEPVETGASCIVCLLLLLVGCALLQVAGEESGYHTDTLALPDNVIVARLHTNLHCLHFLDQVEDLGDLRMRELCFSNALLHFCLFRLVLYMIGLATVQFLVSNCENVFKPE
jgi:hypothetical protein